MLQEMQWHLAKTRAFISFKILLFEHGGQFSSSDMIAARGTEGCKYIGSDGCIVEDPLVKFYEGGDWHVDVELRGLFYHVPKLLRALFEHVRQFKLQLRPTLFARLNKLRHREASLLAGFAKRALYAAKLASCARAMLVEPRCEMLVPPIRVGYLLAGA
jgi:hypothetical protein